MDRAVREQLDELGVPYRIIDIDPDYADTAAFPGMTVVEGLGVPV